jgi:hypothetical protein
VMDKIIHAISLASGFDGKFRERAIKKRLINKNYEKPKSYEKMYELAMMVAEINHPRHQVSFTCEFDSKSDNITATYNICQGEWDDYQETLKSGTGSNVVPINRAGNPSP